MEITEHELGHHRMDDDGGPAVEIFPEDELDPIGITISEGLLTVEVRVQNPDRVSIIVDGNLLVKEYFQSSTIPNPWVKTFPVDSKVKHDVRVAAIAADGQEFTALEF